MKKIPLVLKSIKTVFSRPSSMVIAGAVTIGMIVVNTLLPHRELIQVVFSSDRIGWGQRMDFITSLVFTLGVNTSITGKILMLTVTITAGISIAMLVYYLKRRIKLDIAIGTNVFGILAGIVGIGCASCGSVILTSAVGLSASGAFISFLPLQGLEFGLVSLVLLVWSIWSVSKKIQKGLAC